MIEIADAIRYEDSTHTYWLDGVRVPSITQSMIPATFDQFDFVSPEVLAKKAREGTMVHHMVDIHESSGMDAVLNFCDSDPDAVDLLPDLDAYLAFKKDTGFKPALIEEIVASRKYGFAGRLDLEGKMTAHPGPHRDLIDIKRTATPPRSAGIQTAGQEIALRETFDIPDSVQFKRWVLHLRNGKYKLVPHTDRGDRAVFLSALNVTKWREK